MLIVWKRARIVSIEENLFPSRGNNVFLSRQEYHAESRNTLTSYFLCKMFFFSVQFNTNHFFSHNTRGTYIAYLLSRIVRYHRHPTWGRFPLFISFRQNPVLITNSSKRNKKVFSHFKIKTRMFFYTHHLIIYFFLHEYHISNICIMCNFFQRKTTKQRYTMIQYEEKEENVKDQLKKRKKTSIDTKQFY